MTMGRMIPLLVWMGVIFAFSSLHGSGTASAPPLWYTLERKGAHVVEYGVLMLLSVRCALPLFPRERFRNILWLSGTFALAYAATDELHQFFVPDRGARLTDVAIDGGGILLVAGVLLLLRGLARRTRR